MLYVKIICKSDAIDYYRVIFFFFPLCFTFSFILQARIEEEMCKDFKVNQYLNFHFRPQSTLGHALLPAVTKYHFICTISS